MAAAPSVQSYLTYEQVFGAPPTRSEIEDLLRGLSLDDCLQTVGKLSSLLSTRRLSQRELDLRTAEHLGEKRDGARRLIGKGFVFVFPTRLSTVARIALKVADRRPADAFANGADFPRFVLALLAVADVFDPPGKFASPNSKEVEGAAARMMLRRLAARTDLPLASQLIRYWRIFVDLPTHRPDLLQAGEDFDARLKQQTGIDVKRYITISFGLNVRFLMWDGKANTDWTIDPSYWANTTVTAAEAQAVVARLSATPDELAAAFQNQEAAGFAEIDDLRPFALHPMCEITPDHVMPIEVDLLGPRLFGDGLYWRLHPGTAASDVEKSRYGASVGQLLEEHLAEVAESVYPTPKGGAQRFWRQISYPDGDGPDLVIRDGGRTVFIEVGGERVNALKTLFQGDLASYDNDIAEMLVKHRVEQLDRKITHARAGRLRYANSRSEELGVIHPVICLLDGFPIAPTLRERIDHAVAQAGYLQQPNLGRLEIVSADELEALLGEVDRAGASMSALLNEFALDTELRRWPVRDFLIARRGGLARTQFVEQEWKAITGALAQELFGPHVPPPVAAPTP